MQFTARVPQVSYRLLHNPCRCCFCSAAAACCRIRIYQYQRIKQHKRESSLLLICARSILQNASTFTACASEADASKQKSKHQHAACVPCRFREVLSGSGRVWETLTMPAWSSVHRRRKHRQRRTSLMAWLQTHGTHIRHLQGLLLKPQLEDHPQVLPHMPLLRRLDCCSGKADVSGMERALHSITACSALQHLSINLCARGVAWEWADAQPVVFPPMSMLMGLQITQADVSVHALDIDTSALAAATPQLTRLALPYATTCGSLSHLTSLSGLQDVSLLLRNPRGPACNARRLHKELLFLGALPALKSLRLDVASPEELPRVDAGAWRHLTRLAVLCHSFDARQGQASMPDLHGLGNLRQLQSFELHAPDASIHSALASLAQLSQLTQLAIRAASVQECSSLTGITALNMLKSLKVETNQLPFTAMPDVPAHLP